MRYFGFWKKYGFNDSLLQNSILSANIDNLKYLRRNIVPGDIPNMQYAFETFSMPSFDSYGLACTLLKMLDILYDCVGTVDIYKNLMDKRYKNGDAEYTYAERYASANALHQMVNDVLYPMVSLTLEERKLIFDFDGAPGALTLGQSIVNELLDSLGIVEPRNNRHRTARRQSARRSQKKTRTRR
jgi:hypothetical protein